MSLFVAVCGASCFVFDLSMLLVVCYLNGESLATSDCFYGRADRRNGSVLAAPPVGTSQEAASGTRDPADDSLHGRG